MSDTKEAILQAALELFRENGVAETGLRAIARKSGISNGTLYYHYPAKEDLVMAVFEQMTDELIIEPSLRNNVSASRFIIDLANGVKQDTEYSRDFFFLFQEALRNPDFRKRYRQSLLKWREVWVKFLTAKGVANPEPLAIIYEAIVGGLAMIVAVDPDIDLEALMGPLQEFCKE